MKSHRKELWFQVPQRMGFLNITSEVEAAVRLYNRILQDFYASAGSPALLDEIPASKAERHHLFRDIGYLGRAGLVQVFDLSRC